MQKNVLIAEDDPVARNIIHAFVVKSGYASYICKNGYEAKLLIENNSSYYDYIITDIMMPEFDGIDLAVYIRENINWNKYIIAVSSLSPLVGWNQVFDYWLQKPITYQAIEYCFDVLEREKSQDDTKPYEAIDVEALTRQYRKPRSSNG